MSITKLNQKIKDNVVPVLVTAFLMWAGWVSLQVATSSNIDEINRAQWKVISSIKESETTKEIDELKERVERLEGILMERNNWHNNGDTTGG